MQNCFQGTLNKNKVHQETQHFLPSPFVPFVFQLRGTRFRGLRFESKTRFDFGFWHHESNLTMCWSAPFAQGLKCDINISPRKVGTHIYYIRWFSLDTNPTVKVRVIQNQTRCNQIKLKVPNTTTIIHMQHSGLHGSRIIFNSPTPQASWVQTRRTTRNLHWRWSPNLPLK
jgi:hypothetical protein